MARPALSLLAAVLIGGGLMSGTAQAQSQPWDQWLQEVRAEAAAKGIGQATLESALTGIQPIPRVIELDRRQPEFTLTFQQYMDRVVSPQRVKRGRQLLAENRALLAQVESKYGVPAKYVVALWGIETDFGRLTGGFDVVPALASLAYDGRRSAYFRKELMNALTIIDQGHITAAAMKGSWAGAMGQSQFMPSSFLNYAQDFDGDGRRDIWSTRADVFASAANYLATEGWNKDQTWGRPVKLPKGFDSSLVGLDKKKPLDEWAKLGVRAADGGPLPKVDLQASLILAQDGKGPPFLVYDNFRVFLHWNRSNLFALAAGHLADRIGGR